MMMQTRHAVLVMLLALVAFSARCNAQTCSAGNGGKGSCSSGSRSSDDAGQTGSFKDDTDDVGAGTGAFDFSTLGLSRSEQESLGDLSAEEIRNADLEYRAATQEYERQEALEKERLDAIERSKPLYTSSETEVTMLGLHNWDAFINTPGKYKLVKMYADWCGYCRAFSDEFHVVARAFQDVENVMIGVLNIDGENNAIASTMKEQGVPALWFWNNETDFGVPVEPELYDGFRTSIELAFWLNAKTDNRAMVPGIDKFYEQKAKEDNALKLFGRDGCNVKRLSLDGWEKLIGTKHVLVYFYFDTCQSCFRFAPYYETIADAFVNVERVIIGAVNTNTEPEFARKYNIEYVPAFIWFKRGTSWGTLGERLEGDFSSSTLVQFVNSRIGSRILLDGMEPNDATGTKESGGGDGVEEDDQDFVAPEDKDALPDHKAVYRGNEKGVIELTPKTFDELVHDPTRAVVVEFYAEWCSFCRQTAPTYVSVAGAYQSSRDVTLAALNADHFSQYVSLYELHGYPTIMLFKKKGDKKMKPEIYTGDHTYEDMVRWINQKTGAAGSVVLPKELREPRVEKVEPIASANVTTDEDEDEDDVGDLGDLSGEEEDSNEEDKPAEKSQD